MSWSKWGCTSRHQETADEQMMKTAYFLTATFPRKPPHFFASGHNTISKFTCTSARFLAHSHLEPETREEEIRKAEAEAAFERKRKLYTTKQAHRPPVQITGSRRACFLALFRLMHHFRLLLNCFPSRGQCKKQDFFCPEHASWQFFMQRMPVSVFPSVS